eukprot:286217_1
MSTFALCLCTFIWLTVTSLDIVNISTPKQLTRIFTNASYSRIVNIEAVEMTYYISPNDETKTKYLYYVMAYQINETTEFISGIKSDIFNSDFIQNSAINNLPFTVQEAASDDKYDPPYIFESSNTESCTNPVINDILTCWIKNVSPYGPYHTNIKVECSIFFVNNNTFSTVIPVNNTILGYVEALTVICFNDSYFIPYFLLSSSYINAPIYGLLIDLNGNIRYNEFMKNVSSIDSNLIATKGSNFNATKYINSKATDLFALNYQTLNQSINQNNSTIEGLYGYYTSLDDTKFPIYIYNHCLLSNETWSEINKPYLYSVLDFKEDCCYIQLYLQRYALDPTYMDHLNVLITDIYGNQIDIKQYPNHQDVILIQQLWGADPLFVDLKMISDETTHYFAIFNYPSPQDDNLNVTMANIYYLQQDSINTTQYNLIEVGSFKTAEIVDQGKMMTFDVYNMPHTNDIYISWAQLFASFVNHTLVTYSFDIYGQTFQVK